MRTCRCGMRAASEAEWSRGGVREPSVTSLQVICDHCGKVLCDYCAPYSDEDGYLCSDCMPGGPTEDPRFEQARREEAADDD